MVLINTDLFLAFLAATLVIVLTPGPSVALAMAQAARYGKVAAIRTVAGDALGTALHIIIASIGVNLLVRLAGEILPWLQIFGGFYILWLGYQAAISANHYRPAKGAAPNAARAFSAGFIASVTNPKSIIFFIALFPAFIDPMHGILAQSLIYGTVFIVLDAAMILIYALGSLYLLRRGFGEGAKFGLLSGVGLVVIGLLLVVKGAIAAMG